MTKQTLTAVQRYRLYKTLDEVIEKVDDKTCKYKEEWTDQKVAKEIGCAVNSVMTTRRSLYGQLRNARPAKIVPMNDFDQRLDQLHACVRHLVSQFNLLCVKLGEDELKVRHQIHVED